MDSSTRAVTPLRQRMIDDMRMRKLGDKTQTAYIRAVRRLGLLRALAPIAIVEDLRRFQVYVDRGTSPIARARRHCGMVRALVGEPIIQ